MSGGHASSHPGGTAATSASLCLPPAAPHSQRARHQEGHGRRPRRLAAAILGPQRPHGLRVQPAGRPAGGCARRRLRSLRPAPGCRPSRWGPLLPAPTPAAGRPAAGAAPSRSRQRRSPGCTLLALPSPTTLHHTLPRLWPHANPLRRRQPLQGQCLSQGGRNHRGLPREDYCERWPAGWLGVARSCNDAVAGRGGRQAWAAARAHREPAARGHAGPTRPAACPHRRAMPAGRRPARGRPCCVQRPALSSDTRALPPAALPAGRRPAQGRQGGWQELPGQDHRGGWVGGWVHCRGCV